MKKEFEEELRELLDRWIRLAGFISVLVVVLRVLGEYADSDDLEL